MPRQIQGSQHDFSFGEVDVDLKRNDEHPARKGGLRQAVNTRIRNSGSIQNRSGRRAIFPAPDTGKRIERLTIAAGVDYYIQFAAGHLKIASLAGVTLSDFTLQGNGAAIPWVSVADINSISYTVFGQTVTVCFGHAMRPQVLTWDGVNSWSIADFTELVIGTQKRTPFYRISPQGITLTPAAQTGSVNLTASAPIFTPAHVGTRMRFVGRQMLITLFSSPTLVVATIEESLPGSQIMSFAVDPSTVYSLGDEVIGSVTNSKGLVVGINVSGAHTISVQLLTVSSVVVVNSNVSFYNPFAPPTTTISAFTTADSVVGPAGSIQATGASVIGIPAACADWDEEVMNNLRGYPAACFTDQFRLGFCDFPSVPGGIAWSSINGPADFYVGPNPSDAMFEITPAKTQVLAVVPGPESSEFIFCTDKLYYIPISPTNPLRPGSVAFMILSGDGAAKVQPRLAQEAILYVNAGQNSVMAIIATGAYLRPFNTKNLTDFHSHLFSNIVAIAAPNADGTFNERYTYVLNADGSMAVGKYSPDSLASNMPVVGWVPWSSAGTLTWVSAHAAEVLFTSSYFGASICEVLDDSQFLDAAIPVNAAPAQFAPAPGKGPLWFWANQSAELMDQGTRFMGIYQIDGNGFIVPQNNGGENLALASLVAGQPWTMTIEPFPMDAASGADMHQRMTLRQISSLAVSFLNSTGFMFAGLFCSKQTPTSPPLGTITNSRRVPTWDQGDDATKPPFQRESVEAWPVPGSSYDPRAAIIKDTPGTFEVLEISMEITL